MNTLIIPPCVNKNEPRKDIYSPSGTNISELMREQNKEFDQLRKREQLSQNLRLRDIPSVQPDTENADKYKEKREKWLQDAIDKGNARPLK